MIAVITGDIVDSTEMSPDTYSIVIGLLADAIRDIEERFKAKGQIYRGDSFQISFAEPVYAMKSAVLLRTFLAFTAHNPISVTLSLGVGEATVRGTNPGLSQGPAFINSGRGLDKTPSGSLSVHFENTYLHETLDLPTKFLNRLLASLTRKQANVLYLYVLLDYPDHQKIADRLSTTRQNISKHLNRISAELVREYLEFFEAQINKVNQ